MNSKIGKTSDPHRLLLNPADKINLKRSDKYVALSNLSIYYTWKYIKKSYINTEFKISAPTWNKEFELPDLNYLNYHILYQIFKITLSKSLKKHGEKTESFNKNICK